MKKPKHHRWTVPQLQQLICDWCAGMNLDAMCEKYGATRFAINKQILRMRQEGVSIPRRNAGHLPEQRDKPWTQSEIEYLVRRRNDRITAEQIGIELGRTFLGIQNMIRVLRKEGVPIQMLGNGTRKQWCAERLKAACAGKPVFRTEAVERTNRQPLLVVERAEKAA